VEGYERRLSTLKLPIMIVPNRCSAQFFHRPRFLRRHAGSGARSRRHVSGKPESFFVNMSRVTERPPGKPDERVCDGLPIGEVTIAKPAKADQIADCRRSEH
jgi:hypothetical protein